MLHLKENEIEDYLNDALTPEKVQQIEQHLLHCVLCADAIEGFEMYQKNNNTKAIAIAAAPKHRIMPRWAWVAATAALITIPIGASMLWNNHARSVIFNEHYSTIVGQTTTRGGTATSAAVPHSPEMEAAMEFFNSAEYAESYTALKKIADKDPENTEAALFAGCAALQISKWQSAAELLERVHLSKDETYYAKSLWYLAHAQLQLGNTQRSKDLLQELAADYPEWREKANRFLKDIR